MQDFVAKIKQFLMTWRDPNLRDRRTHYASQNQSCLRDQYWALKGEPETNPVDYVGRMKMFLGDAIEKHLATAVLSKLHVLGYHLFGLQVGVGSTSPTWDGYIDALMGYKENDQWNLFVVEIKTKSGYGANMFYDQLDVQSEHLIQLGLYLKDCCEKKGVTKGCLLYLLLSDQHWGDLVQVNCEYDPKTQCIHALEAVTPDGLSKKLELSESISAALARWTTLDEHIKKGTVPEPEFQYKYPLSAELIRDIPDAKLKKMIEGSVIYGDWQPLYSRYKNKQLEVDHITPERTEEEITVLKSEYKRRHPRSKIQKQTDNQEE